MSPDEFSTFVLTYGNPEAPVLRHCGCCIETDEPCPTCPVCGVYVQPPKFD
jgi:hypothetical protein